MDQSCKRQANCEEQCVEKQCVLQSKCAFVSMGMHSTGGARGLLLCQAGAEVHSGGSAVQDLFGFGCLFLRTLWF